jgi:hypothetical protein
MDVCGWLVLEALMQNIHFTLHYTKPSTHKQHGNQTHTNNSP